MPKTRWITLTTGPIAILALLLSGCTGSPAGHERWLRSQKIVTSVSSTEIPGRKLGQPATWEVVATLAGAADLAAMAQLVEAWPRRAHGSRLTIVRPASAAGPELTFTARPNSAATRTRWAVFTELQAQWPLAQLSMKETATLRLPGPCDPWDELARIDAVELLTRPDGPALSLGCQTPTEGTVTLSRRSVPDAAELTGLRERTRAVLATLPADTPWVAAADDPARALQLEVTTGDVPANPTTAVLAAQRTELTIKTGAADLRIEVRVTGAADLRPAARAAAGAPTARRIEADSRTGTVHLWADLSKLSDIAEVAQHFPEQIWWATGSGDGATSAARANWVRATGAGFPERTRQYQALVGSGIPWTSIVLHENFGEPTLSVEVAGVTDWTPVVRAIRAVRWTGEMKVEIGSGYPAVEFRSTATGPADNPQIANALRPPNREQHPELIAIIEAWDATAS